MGEWWIRIYYVPLTYHSILFIAHCTLGAWPVVDTALALGYESLHESLGRPRDGVPCLSFTRSYTFKRAHGFFNLKHLGDVSYRASPSAYT